MSETETPTVDHDDPQTTAELLRRIEAAWSELWQTVAGLSEEQLTTIRDEQGWSAKDHLVHVTTWEQSLLALLQGRNREQAIGLGDADESEHNIDDINAVIHQRNQHRSLEDVVAGAQSFHQELIAAISALSDDGLFKPYSYYQPEALPYEAASVVGWINGNTWDHYGEHTAWIRGLNAS